MGAVSGATTLGQSGPRNDGNEGNTAFPKAPALLVLYTQHNIHIYTCTCRIHIEAMNKRRAKSSLKKYTSHFIVRFACERELETEQNCNILIPTLMAISVVSFSFSRAAQPEAQGPISLLDDGFLYRILSTTGLVSKLHQGSPGPLLLGGGFLYHIFSPTHLISNSCDFRFPPSYIIVQSPTLSLEWLVWSPSSGNNCHAVQRSLSFGVSVYECIMGFYLVPFHQPNPPTRFLHITAMGMCYFLPVHHFGMACLARSKVNI